MREYHPMFPQPGNKEALIKQNYIYEPNLDGIRVIIYKENDNIILVNRKGQNISFKYPELAHVWRHINAESAVLDGIIAVLDKKGEFNPGMLQERELLDNIKEIGQKSREIPAALFVFDLLSVFGVDFSSESLDKRKTKLAEIVKESPAIRLVKHVGNGRELLREIQEKNIGIAGVIAKDIRSSYIEERDWAWLKIDRGQSANCVVAGYMVNEDKEYENPSTVELLLAVLQKSGSEGQFQYIGKTEVKFDDSFYDNVIKERFRKLKTKKKDPQLLSDDEIRDLLKIYSDRKIIWLRPKLIAKVKYFGMNENSKLREFKSPVFLRLRNDKWIEDCKLAEKL